jgi:protein-disulfide isomerase-like protein with CxxC motif
VKADAALAYAGKAQSQRPLTRADADAARLGINGTPTFTVAHGNGPAKVVSADALLGELASGQ